MNSTITLTERGVITLPAALRRAAGLKANDQLVAEPTADGGILLRPVVTVPIEMYSAERIAEFDESEADLAGFIAKRDAKISRKKKSAR